MLAGYAGIACGLFAGALACATAAVIFFFNTDDVDCTARLLDRYNGCTGCLVVGLLGPFAFLGGLSLGLGLGL